MNQLRFQIKAGSAARAAQESTEGTPRSSFRVEGGSAARASEQRERQREASPRSQNGFSLRAQNGTVVRRAAEQDEPTPVPTTHAEAAPSSPAQASVQPDLSERPWFLRRLFSAFE